MQISLITILPLLASMASAKVLLDYKGGQPASDLGNVELEGQNLGDKIKAGDGGDDVYIRPETDPESGLEALHYHREPHFRRTEVKAMANKIEEDKTYYIGYHLRLEKTANSLVIFQWKKHDKTVSPIQNIPFHLEFEGDELTLGYTVPDGDRTPRWKGKFSAGAVHHIGLVINTSNSGSGYLELWIDGVQMDFDNGEKRLSDVYLFTGPTSPKFGMYRAELNGSGDESSHRFDSWVYRVMISDKSLDEVAEAAGTSG
ncbi:hypothetical protein EDC01DRAFT_340133 [Geopyxis carbonaria]|nr:hypothetical protein EDC01DRAFT_340133 [Geopyxis carbonaria]